MKMCIHICLSIMLIVIAAAATPPVDGESPKGIIAAENFVQRLPALWAHGTENALFDMTTNAVDAILSMKDTGKCDLAFASCAGAVASLDVEQRDDDDYSRSLDLRKYVFETMLRYSGKTAVGIQLCFDCRVKLYETLRRESEKYPVVKLPRFVDDLKAAMPSNCHSVSFAPEDVAKRRKEMNEIARAVSKRRRQALYGESVRREVESEEENYYDNSLKYYYGKLSDKCRTNVIEKVHSTIGRYPKWYSPK